MSVMASNLLCRFSRDGAEKGDLCWRPTGDPLWICDHSDLLYYILDVCSMLEFVVIVDFAAIMP